MKRLISPQSVITHRQFSAFKDRLWPKQHRPRSRHFVAFLTCVWAISLFCLPTGVHADLGDDIADTFEDIINGLIGTEFGPVQFRFAYKPPDVVQPPFPPVSFDSVHVDVTILGFAFCNPSNKWATPDPTPTFPFNAYGCENVATVGATATPEATSSEVAVTVSDFFLDLEYVRETTLACLETPGGTHAADAYLLTEGTVTMSLTLERVGTCLHAGIVPGSVEVILTEKEHGLQTDECLDLVWPLFSVFFYDMVNATASAALESALTGMIADINAVLCPLTPVAHSTWGGVKDRYRDSQ